MVKQFLRSDTRRHLRIGKRRRKLQKWRKPRGRHNKVRKQRFSYPASPRVGYKSPRKESGKINGAIPVRVSNIKELLSVPKGASVILARVGAKKKLELIKKANEMKISLLNVEVQNESK